MSSPDPQAQLKDATEWAKRPQPTLEPAQSGGSWLPIIIITLLIVAAAWWWWANYGYGGSGRNKTAPVTLNALRQGAKGHNSKLVVKPNGSVVASH